MPQTVCRRVAVVIGILSLWSPSGVSGDETWKVFESKEPKYRVDYPASWYELPGVSGVLDIISFPPSERVQGVVLRDGGAEIEVSARARSAGSIDEWIKSERGTRDLLAQGNVAVGKTKLMRVRLADDINAFTDFYLEVAGNVYRVTLTTWKGEKAQAAYEELASKVAASVRTGH